MKAERPLDRGAFMHERVYERIRDMIVDGRLAPGDRLIETTLAATLGVSRTPVRESIRRLLQEKWVVLQETGGVTVRRMSAKDLVDAYTTRAALEAVGGRLAAQNATRADVDRLRKLTLAERAAMEAGQLEKLSRLNTRFHDGVAVLSGNQPLLDALNGLAIHTVYYKRAIATAAQDPAWHAQYLTYVAHRLSDHERVVELLDAHAADEVEDWMRRHVVENADNLVKLLRLEPDAGSDVELSRIQLSTRPHP
ncbi:GntR family transcriptional regulator [Phytohabitans sp. ZYX-F-186]|uniref:GntR family transcriptional regulator n=1 Tax=Phytohabitans maris TaxID=3071409 RepID=A0ABU0ZUB0_9ACTN|nr:GntR family transcriptional regulator [Phytohabitans sp. ZYX-F-186]MDQ7909909.1 GntR family transcriptional regulator [Phytohabitans sp. ZYX-F-186]